MNYTRVGTLFAVALLSFAALAEHHGSTAAAKPMPDDLSAAIAGFDRAYTENDVEAYFAFYADSATVYFFGERQDMAAYHTLWTDVMESGGGVEKNDASDLRVQVMPGGDVAISTYFVDNRTRYPDGTITTARAFETDVWQKIDGAWQIVSLHYSEIPAEESER